LFVFDENGKNLHLKSLEKENNGLMQICESGLLKGMSGGKLESKNLKSNAP